MSDGFDSMKDIMRRKLQESIRQETPPFGQPGGDASPPPPPAGFNPPPTPQSPAAPPREAARQVRHHLHHPSGLILTNIETVPGMTITEHFGLVNGSMVRAKHVGTDILASLKNLIGGELGGYSRLLDETRTESIERMVKQAQQMGANAIVNVRFSTSSVAQGAAELYVYGTAVRVE